MIILTLAIWMIGWATKGKEKWMEAVHKSNGTGDISKERGFSPIEYKVLKKDMTVVFTTKDKEKAEKMAQEIGGYVHANR